jgi:hypothetical protein
MRRYELVGIANNQLLLEPIVEQPAYGDTRQTIHSLLLRVRGCTRADLLKATGWKSINVYAQGIKVRVDKSERPYRYYGVPS